MKLNLDVSSQTPVVTDRQKQNRLVDAARQFEASLLQELLKPMQHAKDNWGAEEKSNDSSTDTLSSFGTEAVAKAISEGGGFGIAKQIVSKVTVEQERSLEKKISQY